MLDTGQLGIVSGTRNLQAALEFVRFATSAQSMAAVSGHIAYSPVRESALPLVGTHIKTGIDMDPHMPTNRPTPRASCRATGCGGATTWTR